MKFWEEAQTLTDDAVSDELFDFKGYTTLTLVYQLAGQISVIGDDPRRIQLLQEWEDKSLCRGDICRLLAVRGVGLRTIHRRKS